MMVEELKWATDHLRHGHVILYPTDTIWGLGCDATNPEAVQRIYRIKQRSERKNMLVLVADIVMLGRYLENVPDKAIEILRDALKPTTIIYPRARNLAANLVARDGSVGIRITSDPFCIQLILSAGFPIVSTSANISGSPAPVCFAGIDPGIKEQVDYVVNWRRDEPGLSAPSAIIRVNEQGEAIQLRD
jgi:L-threonylcarbamoyladenylate synthase